MRQSLAVLSLAPMALAASSASMELFWPSDFAVNALQPAATAALPTPALSIISANAKTTVAAVGCADSSDDCAYSGITYTKIDTTVYKYAFQTDLAAGMSVSGMAGMTLAVNVDCTSKSDVTCAVAMPSPISIPGVDISELLSPFLGTTTYSGSAVAFTTAPVTKGAEKLSGSGSGASGAAPSSSGANGTVSGGASPTSSGKPAEQTGAATNFGVEMAAIFGLAGAAAAQLW
jgi:hypothetical protein